MNPKRIRILAGVVAIAALAACSLNYNRNDSANTNTNGPTPVETKSPSPSPSASPSPTSTSDAVSMAIFAFGYDTAPGAPAACQAPAEGQRLNAAQEYVVPVNCRLAITATPKTNRDANGDGKPDDATNHGNAIAWSTTGPGSVSPRAENPLFNQDYSRTGAGLATVTAKITLPDGRLLEAVRGFRN